MERWTMIWHQAMTRAMFGGWTPAPKNTVVFPLTAPVSGEAVRLRFANYHGRRPYAVGAVTVWMDGKPYPVTLSGKTAFRIPVGGPVTSDPLALPVPAGARLELRLFTTNAVNDCNAIEGQASLLHGDATRAALSGEVRKPRFMEAMNANNSIPVLEAVELLARKGKAIVAFGDSITAQSRWTKPLAQRLLARYGGEYILLNAGISGNCLLYEPPGIFGATFGEKGTARFARDVLAVPELHTVILALGVNDVSYLNDKTATLLQLDRYKDAVAAIVETLHKRGVRVVMQTLTPRLGVDRSPGMYTPPMEALRLSYNQWIRSVGIFDDVFDAEAVVAESRADGLYFKEGYHLGDHLHPNAAGGRLLADAYDLTKLTGDNSTVIPTGTNGQ